MAKTVIAPTASFFVEETIKSSRTKDTTKTRTLYGTARAAIEKNILVVVDEGNNRVNIRR